MNIALAFAGTAWGGTNVSLSWAPCLDASVAGYKVFYGTASLDYTTVMDAGNATAMTISNLTQGATYYFAIVTYDANGFESGFSSEAVYTVPLSTALTTPAAPPQLQIQIHRSSSGQIIVTLPGQSGHVYDIEATADFMTWPTIGTVTATADGPIDFTDSDAGNFPRRFYRVLDNP